MSRIVTRSSARRRARAPLDTDARASDCATPSAPRLEAEVEQLDIFLGAWCATMVPHLQEEEFTPREDPEIPLGARYLKAALDHTYYNGDVEKLRREIDADLFLRGLDMNRRKTFACRIVAYKVLLDNTGRNGLQIPANLWDARRIPAQTAKAWSPQQREVIETVRKGVAVDDANVDVHSRMILVTGQPGAGKTAAVIACATEAAAKGERGPKLRKTEK